MDRGAAPLPAPAARPVRRVQSRARPRYRVRAADGGSDRERPDVAATPRGLGLRPGVRARLRGGRPDGDAGPAGLAGRRLTPTAVRRVARLFRRALPLAFPADSGR